MEIPRKLLDSTKLISKGWKPSIGLSEGLSSVYEWYLKIKFNYLLNIPK